MLELKFIHVSKRDCCNAKTDKGVFIVVQLAVWYKTKFGSQNLATKFGNHLYMATKIGSQC